MIFCCTSIALLSWQCSFLLAERLSCSICALVLSLSSKLKQFFGTWSSTCVKLIFLRLPLNKSREPKRIKPWTFSALLFGMLWISRPSKVTEIQAISTFEPELVDWKIFVFLVIFEDSPKFSSEYDRAPPVLSLSPSWILSLYEFIKKQAIDSLLNLFMTG